MVRHKILLVDDNQELLRLLARLLEADGLQPVTCWRGKDALKAMGTEKPAVAILDVLLPDMMGYDLAPAFKSAGVPVIFMTGVFKGRHAASEARIQHGAAGYFEKPFEARKLLAAIRGLLPPDGRPIDPPGPSQRIDHHGDDFDMEIAVESDEPVEAMDLTGKVEVHESDSLSAVFQGAALRAAPVAPGRAPARPSTGPARPGQTSAKRSEPAGEGDLRDNLPELVTAFWLTQQTGELAVSRGRVKKAIFFERGRPVYAVSNLVADRFGPFLVRVGKLTAPQLELCQAAAQKKGRKPDDVLVEMGILKEAEKVYYLAQRVKAIAYSLFAWEEGRYRMHFSDRASLESTKVEIDPAHLIWRAVHKLYRPERLARLLGDGDRLIPTQQPAYGLHEIDLQPWQAQLLTKVDGLRSVSELVALSQQPEPSVRASLWALVALEILEKRA